MKRNKIRLVSGLLICAMAVTSCSFKSEIKKRVEVYLTSYPDGNVQDYKFINDEDNLYEVMNSRDFKEKFSRKTSVFSYSVSDLSLRMPNVDWSELNATYHFDSESQSIKKDDIVKTHKPKDMLEFYFEQLKELNKDIFRDTSIYKYINKNIVAKRSNKMLMWIF